MGEEGCREDLQSSLGMESEREERPQQVLCSRAGDESGELELEDKNGTKVSLLDCMARGFPWKECLQA